MTAELPAHDLADEGVYQSLEYKGIDLSARTAESLEMERCRLTSAKLVGTKLQRAVISDTLFEQCDLANLDVRESSVIRTKITTSRLTGTSWINCLFRDAVFDSTPIDLATFRFSRFKKVVFQGCKLPRADFQDADLRGVRFEHCDLTGAQFSNAEMTGTRFINCSLFDINGVFSLKGAIVKSADAMDLAYSLASALGITVED